MKIKKLQKVLISIIILLVLLITGTYIINNALLGNGRDNSQTGLNKIPDLNNTVYLSHTIQSPVKAEHSFNFLRENLSEVYTDIAEGHKYFTIRNGDKIEKNSIIDCLETAGNQTITHEYHVTEFIDNSRIAYISRGSKVLVELPWQIVKSESNTYVFYDILENKDGTTDVKLTIGVQFSNSFEKFFSVLTGGLIPWKKHCIEEMEGLKKVMSKS